MQIINTVEVTRNSSTHKTAQCEKVGA